MRQIGCTTRRSSSEILKDGKTKKAKAIIALLVIFILILVFVAYIMLPDVIKLAVRSIVDTPICDSRIANKLGIDSNAVRDYVIKSLEPGMTPTQVEETLTKIAPISRIDTSIETDESVYSSIRVNTLLQSLGRYCFRYSLLKKWKIDQRGRCLG